MYIRVYQRITTSAATVDNAPCTVYVRERIKRVYTKTTRICMFCISRRACLYIRVTYGPFVLTAANLP